jgi:hypothetical protein
VGFSNLRAQQPTINATARPLTICFTDAFAPSKVQEGVAMSKPTISFRHFGGSGPLSVYWHPGPYGDAVEARPPDV